MKKKDNAIQHCRHWILKLDAIRLTVCAQNVTSATLDIVDKVMEHVRNVQMKTLIVLTALVQVARYNAPNVRKGIV